MDYYQVQIDKDDVFNSRRLREQQNAHNSKQVSLMSLSPDGTYVVTYSEGDNSIEGWKFVNDSELMLDSEPKFELDEYEYIKMIKVTNNKVVCYADSYSVKVFQMPNKHNKHKPINLIPSPPKLQCPGINFKENDLIIFDNFKILIYFMQNDKLILKSSCELSSYNEVIGVSIDDNNIWVISPNYLFHWDLETFQLKFSYSLGFTASNHENDDIFTVIYKENSIIIKNYDKIAIFLKDVHFPIRIIQLEDINTELCEVQNNYLLVFNLPLNEKQNINLYHITDINKQLIDASKIFNEDSKDDTKNKFLLYKYNSKSGKAFGLVNKKFTSKNLSDSDWCKRFRSHKEDDDFIGWNNYLCEEKNYYNDTLAFPDMENIKSLISNECKKESNSLTIDFINQNYKWIINLENRKLSVCSNEDKEDKKSNEDKDISEEDLNTSWNTKWSWKILNNNALALRYYGNTVGESIKIYEYDINNKKIEIKYYYKKGFVKLNNDDFSGPKLPIMPITDDIYKDNKNDLIKIINSIIKDGRCLVKYGTDLLPIFIKSSDPELTHFIEDIYKKCVEFVKDDPKRNLKFLSIITLSLNDLYEKYSGFLTKVNSEMFMILDPFNEKVVNKKNKRSHFHTFSQETKIVKITKYSKFLKFFQGFYKLLYSFLELRYLKTGSKSAQYITLIVPYIDYSRYPSKYSTWKEIINPQPSVFVNTCKKEFFTNWNGEAIINYKWKTFGKTYYFIIWLLFIVFLICFTIASYPTNFITQEIRIKLYQTSIAFGFYHILYELRQFCWSPKKYLSIWNLFDLSAYLSATITSIYWVKYDNIPDWALSLTCLLLDFKFLLFFRIFEYFGVYFAIIFGVAKRVFSFLVVLAIILASFAHAFFLLLHPQNLLDSLKLDSQNPNDPNNPWTLSNTYNQVDENGTILNKTAFIQTPSENTNLFYSYPTSLLATYLFLTGNQNSLSPWSPKSTTENTLLFILMVVFSFLIVIYLMNLFIGLLNNAIEKDNDRASYLVQKAEIIAEIELFYLLPYQRRWSSWFPEVIYYQVDVEKARIYIKEAINKGIWKKDDWPEMKIKILKVLNIEDAVKD